jgi:transcriptional regulator of acetoin/glycerol metabolism
MLPPLRERSDLRALVQRILDSESSIPRGLSIDDEVLALFERHPWPGNMRQLANLLRTAGVMAADDGVIGRPHLPDDFIDELDHRLSADCSRPRARRASRRPAIWTA